VRIHLYTCPEHGTVLSHADDGLRHMGYDRCPWVDRNALPVCGKPLVHSMSRQLSGDCERDCQTRCAYPGQFSECALGARIEEAESRNLESMEANPSHTEEAEK